MKYPTTPLSSPAKATKRPAPDDEDVLEQQPAKRLKTNASVNGSDPSPRKKRLLEEDGLVILDGPEGGEEDSGIIVID